MKCKSRGCWCNPEVNTLKVCFMNCLITAATFAVCGLRAPCTVCFTERFEFQARRLLTTDLTALFCSPNTHRKCSNHTNPRVPTQSQINTRYQLLTPPALTDVEDLKSINPIVLTSRLVKSLRVTSNISQKQCLII